MITGHVGTDLAIGSLHHHQGDAPEVAEIRRLCRHRVFEDGEEVVEVGSVDEDRRHPRQLKGGGTGGS